MTQETRLHIGTTPWDWSAVREGPGISKQARTAEQYGFDSFWLPESHFSGGRSVPAPLLLLAAAAAATSRIELGCVSYLLPIRNAVLAAEEIAVLDRLSEGRLILGLGRGIAPAMFEAFGIDSGDKRALFAQRLQQIRDLWQADGALGLAPLPLQTPEPRLWAAALGPKALQQIALLGLPYLASPLESFDLLAQNLAAYRRNAPAEAVRITPIMRTVFIAESSRAGKALEEGLARQLRAAGKFADQQIEDVAIIGSAESVHARIDLYREALGMTHLILRAGLPGVSATEELDSACKLLEMFSQPNTDVDAIHR
ncbi:hypothetical protein A3709_10150 [Halioglobus sp. HI00S01]|uniref:LLM class flavin-dependent oxidoreductase n=1 Tax=Halioglobus sp. HI00S01 TaxID=1822214 RepID=UPI0007C38232|nr:LLM class flavin-dependent oxidoreductase [Halioglobus sp. HI00S01]KZX53478.1 hypothetical protein A3709_10150 [Halioglobus sp. HI00S01]